MVAPRRTSAQGQQQQPQQSQQSQQQSFSQFGGLTGDLETGSRRRQGLAEARRTAAQGRGRGALGGGARKKVAIMRGAFVASLCFAFAIVWAIVVITFDFGDTPLEFKSGSGHLPQPSLRSEVPWRDAGTGWDDAGLSNLKELFDIGRKNPNTLATLLEERDPLNVSVKSPAEFKCPPKNKRFSEPDVRNHEAEKEFKEGKGFVYYQHLRKAGGTGFCEMAGRNMPRSQVPRYHCMPDDRGAMATPPWSKKEYLLSQMKSKGHRITANEWDAFPKSHLGLPGAVFGTTFRHPVDRWYSQYRFEHVEHRDGSTREPRPFEQWYKNMRPYVMGDNYYVKTFSGMENPSSEELKKDVHRSTKKPRYEVDLSWSYRKFDSWGQKAAWEDFEAAVNTLRRFNLLLILDFVNDEMWALEEALGWTQARIQVLPHEKQAVRTDKKSIPAREALQQAVWKECLSANVFDLLLFHWAKRMYLERSACRQTSAHAIESSTIMGGDRDGTETV